MHVKVMFFILGTKKWWICCILVHENMFTCMQFIYFILDCACLVLFFSLDIGLSIPETKSNDFSLC